MMRCQEDGWERIGAVDSSGRRSLWVRFTWEHDPPDQGDVPHTIELCAGREGDDVYLRLHDSMLDYKLFVTLFEVLGAAQYAAEDGRNKLITAVNALDHIAAGYAKPEKIAQDALAFIRDEEDSAGSGNRA